MTDQAEETATSEEDAPNQAEQIPWQLRPILGLVGFALSWNGEIEGLVVTGKFVLVVGAMFLLPYSVLKIAEDSADSA